MPIIKKIKITSSISTSKETNFVLLRSSIVYTRKNTKVFSESDIEALDIILNKFNGMTPKELSEFSHQFPEWKQYEESLKNPQKKNGYKINLDLFFENKEEESGLFTDSPELLQLTKEVYHQYKGC